MAKKNRVVIIVSAVACALLATICFTVRVNAERENSEYVRKAMYQGLHGCVQDGFMKDIVIGENNYMNLTSIYVSQDDAFKRPLPGTEKINCYEIIAGRQKSDYGDVRVQSVWEMAGAPVYDEQNALATSALTLYYGYYNNSYKTGERTYCVNFEVPVHFDFVSNSSSPGGSADVTRKTDVICIDYQASDDMITNVRWQIDPPLAPKEDKKKCPDDDQTGCWNSYMGQLQERFSWNRIVDMNTSDDCKTAWGVMTCYSRSGNNAFTIDASSKTIKYEGTGGSISWAGKTWKEFADGNTSMLAKLVNGDDFTKDRTTRSKRQALIAWGTHAPVEGASPEDIGYDCTINDDAICEWDDSAAVWQVYTKPASLVQSGKTTGEGDGPYSVYTGDMSVDSYRAVAQLNGYTGTLDNSDMREFAEKKMYLTKTEQILLYMYYLNTLLDAQVDCETDGASLGSPIKWYKTGETAVTENCYITSRAKENSGLELNAVSNLYGSSTFKGEYKGTINWNGLVDFFSKVSTTLDTPSDNGGTTYMSDPSSGSEADGADPSCYDSAGSSNWIACPIIENGTSASIWMYNAIENFLQVNTTLFKDNQGESGSFGAWSAFRDIANVVFVGVFIIVIISQVTGFGIDNYGIKKILPKLVLGALLVNVSYFMCQASVDIGNILGGGVKDLLNRMQEGLAGGSSKIAFAFGGAKAMSATLTGGAALILVAIVGAAFYITGGEVLIPILLGVIGVLIGILFLLVLLAVRQGLAVILVAISPLAFVAYMLPNTRTLFSKWLKLFSGVLLAYPICSMVIYGGQMVSTIILLASAGSDSTVTNIALALTSAILSIAPVFFIPSLISKSMTGISTVANGLKARATSLGKGAFDRSKKADTIRDISSGWKDKIHARSARKTLGKLEGKDSFAARARKRAARNTLLGIDRRNADYYGGETKTMDKDQLVSMGASAFGTDKKGQSLFDSEKFDAALSQLYATGNDKEAFSLIQSMSENVGKMNTEQLEKYKSVIAQRGGTVGKAYAKYLGKHNAGANITDAMNDSRMKGIMEDLGKNALSDMSKDEMDYLAQTFGSVGSGLFTPEQYTAAAAAHTGSAAAKYLNMLGQSGFTSQVKAGLSDTDFLQLDEQTRKSMFTSQEIDSRVASIVASGDKNVMSAARGTIKQKISQEVQAQQQAQQAAQQQAQQAQQAQQQAAQQTAEEIKQGILNLNTQQAQYQAAQQQAQQTAQQTAQDIVAGINDIRNNMKRPPETFSDGGGI